MNVFKQIGAIGAMNLRSIPQRLGTSSVIVIGIAGVVAVLLSVMAMAVGIMSTISSTGRADRAIVLRAGSTAELQSSITRDAVLTISNAPGIKRSMDGKPLISAETITLMDATTADNSWANVVVRGVGPATMEMRPEMKIVEGRMFQPAVHELIVGQKVPRQFPGLAVGKRIEFANSSWEVVGMFESGGDQHESEVLGDSETVVSAARRGTFQPVSVLLDSPGRFEEFKTALTTNPTLEVDVKRESEYFKEQSGPIGRTISIIAYVVGGIMAVGALFGALNTMYSAVSQRTREIATLRALGFGPGAVVVSVFVEAVLLAFIGAVIGSTAAWLFFDGNVVSTSASGGISQLMFALTVTPALVALGIIWACAIGLLGGLFPAIRAARLPVATALRAT
jgi:putative ABC transport system permease protein